MFQKHYSDEQLLAHLDGEISGWERGRLESHLLSCWTCRARRAAIERQIHQIAEPFEEKGYPDDGWTDQQIERFRRSQREYEAGAAISTIPAWPKHSFPVFYWGAAAALLVAFAIFQVVRIGGKESAVELAAAATRMDSAAEKQPLHQSFRVEWVRESGSRTVKTGQMEIWSDPEGGRYAARLREGGQLVFAAWKPKPHEEYWHGAPEPKPLRLASLAAGQAGSFDGEELLLRWLASRKWQPISIAGEFCHFLSQDGVTLRAERFRTAGTNCLRLIAQRQAGRTSITMTAEFTQTDHRPRLLRLRVENPNGAAEIRLASERIEIGPEVRFANAVFEPDTRPVPTGPVPLSLPRRLPDSSSGPAAASALPHLDPDSTTRQAAERELEVRYALHRMGACLGEPIQVEVAADGRVTVSGLVDQESRREALRNALQELSYVQFAVRIVAESVVPSAGEHPAASGTTPQTVVASGKLLIEERLASYFRQSSKAEVPRKIAALSNAATAATAGLAAHAWAVRRLHAAYPLERIARLRPQSRWILEDMLGDHFAAMRSDAVRVLDLLEPALGATPAEAGGMPEHGFSQTVQDVFQSAAATDRLCRSVFGLSQLDPGEESQAISSLMENLVRLRRDATVARARAAAEIRKAASPENPRLARDAALPTPKEK